MSRKKFRIYFPLLTELECSFACCVFCWVHFVCMHQHRGYSDKKKNSVDWKLHLIPLIESPYFQFYHMKQTHTNFTQFICGVVFEFLVQKNCSVKIRKEKNIIHNNTIATMMPLPSRRMSLFLRLQALSTSIQRWRRNHEASFTHTHWHTNLFN